jgi:hypothetical protein
MTSFAPSIDADRPSLSQGNEGRCFGKENGHHTPVATCYKLKPVPIVKPLKSI